MPKKTKPKSPRPASPRPSTYFYRSQEPLQALFFLLPLIVLYELGTVFMAATGDGKHVQEIRAYHLLKVVFERFDVNWYYLPGLIVVAVLLCWHVAKKDPWRFEPKTFWAMWGEAVLWSLPLLVAGLVFSRQPVVAAGIDTVHLTAADGSVAVQLKSVINQLILSIGAGVYEELLFRLIAIALLHALFCDLLALPHTWGASAAIIISAVAFGLYHFDDPNVMHWSAAVWNSFLFKTCAGVYLALLYVLRGFGIVAGAHAVYDILVTLLGVVLVRGH